MFLLLRIMEYVREGIAKTIGDFNGRMLVGVQAQQEKLSLALDRAIFTPPATRDRPPSFILLVGFPGTGKTHALRRAIAATSAKGKYIKVSIGCPFECEAEELLTELAVQMDRAAAAAISLNDAPDDLQKEGVTEEGRKSKDKDINMDMDIDDLIGEDENRNEGRKGNGKGKGKTKTGGKGKTKIGGKGKRGRPKEGGQSSGRELAKIISSYVLHISQSVPVLIVLEQIDSFCRDAADPSSEHFERKHSIPSLIADMVTESGGRVTCVATANKLAVAELLPDRVRSRGIKSIFFRQLTRAECVDHLLGLLRAVPAATPPQFAREWLAGIDAVAASPEFNAFTLESPVFSLGPAAIQALTVNTQSLQYVLKIPFI